MLTWQTITDRLLLSTSRGPAGLETVECESPAAEVPWQDCRGVQETTGQVWCDWRPGAAAAG